MTCINPALTVDPFLFAPSSNQQLATGDGRLPHLVLHLLSFRAQHIGRSKRSPHRIALKTSLGVGYPNGGEVALALPTHPPPLGGLHFFQAARVLVRAFSWSVRENTVACIAFPCRYLQCFCRCHFFRHLILCFEKIHGV